MVEDRIEQYEGSPVSYMVHDPCNNKYANHYYKILIILHVYISQFTNIYFFKKNRYLKILKNFYLKSFLYRHYVHVKHSSQVLSGSELTPEFPWLSAFIPCSLQWSAESIYLPNNLAANPNPWPISSKKYFLSFPKIPHESLSLSLIYIYIYFFKER